MPWELIHRRVLHRWKIESSSKCSHNHSVVLTKKKVYYTSLQRKHAAAVNKVCSPLTHIHIKVI